MPQVTYELDHRYPIAVLRLQGELAAGSVPQVRAALLGALVEEPTSLIVDLAELTTTEDPAVKVFSQVAARATGWPDAAVLLCNASTQVVTALRADSAHGPVAVYPTFSGALAAAAGDALPLRTHRRLEPDIHAPRHARELAAEVCAEWNVPGYAVPTEILASELVTNAVRHAATALDLRITYRGEQLRVSVHDRDRQMARLQTPAESDDHGRGLLIVNSVASRWGSEPVAGGKVVWATLQVSSRTTADLVDTEQ